MCLTNFSIDFMTNSLDILYIYKEKPSSYLQKYFCQQISRASIYINTLYSVHDICEIILSQPQNKFFEKSLFTSF